MWTDDYESFTEQQQRLLDHYVTNTSGHVFALRNLPEVVKGVLFSRYSRSNLGLRSLLLKEFIGNEEEVLFSDIAGEDLDALQQEKAIQKARSFYDRILDGYGDDSIGELGGAHLAVENVSMLAAKCLEEGRVGGSPLEKSTRYVHFDQKVHGEYLFYREPVLMTSAYRCLYLNTCNELFSTYSRLIPLLTETIDRSMPKGSFLKEEIACDHSSSVAYRVALRAKVLDSLRGLLPASALTNLGIFGNGRFFEQLLHKLHTHDLTELQEIGRRSFDELSKVIPSFVRRASTSHRTHQSYALYRETMESDLKALSLVHAKNVDRSMVTGVRLVNYDPNGASGVAAALLYPYMDRGLEELTEYCRGLSEEERVRIFEAAAGSREQRRHKSPRALEHAWFTFEITADYGAYRDLQRHRMLTQERQRLTCDYGFYLPPELEGSPFEGEYREVMQKAKHAYTVLSSELPDEAQYVVPMGYCVRWYFHVDLRALQWLCELRSQPQGHASYRKIAQEVTRQVCQVVPSFERFFKFVDHDDHDLGRFSQEERAMERIKEVLQ